MDTVSAIIIVYNDARFIARAIESALQQTYEKVEVIVVDDGSEDTSFEIASTFIPRGVRVIKKENAGAASARNLGVKYASGDHVAFLDSDDVWVPEKIKKMIEACSGIHEPCFVYTGYRFVDENLRPIMRSFVPTAECPFQKLLHCSNQILPSTMMVHREVFNSIGGFPEDQAVRGYEDAVFALLAARRFRAIAVPEPLTLYFYSDSGQGRSAVYDYKKSLHLQRAVFACVKKELNENEFTVFENEAWVNNFCKFAMHGQLHSARRLKREMNIKANKILRSIRGMLALLSAYSRMNLLFWCRMAYQSTYKKMHRPVKI